jgi:hypothetical protein
VERVSAGRAVVFDLWVHTHMHLGNCAVQSRLGLNGRTSRFETPDNSQLERVEGGESDLSTLI